MIGNEAGFAAAAIMMAMSESAPKRELTLEEAMAQTRDYLLQTLCLNKRNEAVVKEAFDRLISRRIKENTKRLESNLPNA